MSTEILNGAPMTIFTGVDDKSTRTLVAEAESLPTHLAHVWGYAKEGPTDPQLVVGNSRTLMYGADSFDERKKWATHATILSNVIDAQGNPQFFQRVKPDDAAPPANVRVLADVLPTKIPEYVRNVDGSIKRDNTGALMTTGQTIQGYSVKFVTEHIAVDQDGNSQFGLGAIEPGDQVDATTSTQSQRYPLFDLEVSSFGDHGNNKGFRLWAPTSASINPVNTSLIADEKAYPIRIACIKRDDPNSSAQLVATNFAEQYLNLVLKPDVIDRQTDTEVYFGTQFLPQYQNLEGIAGSAPMFGPFGQIHVYDDQIALLLGEFYTAEKPFIDAFSDFDGSADEEYRFNLFGGVSSQNVPYHSYQLVSSGADAVRFTENTNIYASGGTDGTMSEAALAVSVAALVAGYADPNSYLQDAAKYPTSIIYDSGFPLDTKYAIISAIGLRKDIAVVISTHDVLGRTLSASEESSLAVALRTRLQMYPESDFFGTPALRGLIVARSGRLLTSKYKKRLPLTIELASKAAAYMGAGNGVWNPIYAFDQADNNQVTMFADINATFTPAAVRNKDWDNGMVWVESYGHRSVYFPAIQTVYPNDTSVLKSFFTMMGVVELEKVGDRVRRMFSGNSKLTRAQLVDRINKEVLKQTNGRFDSRFVIVPETYFTDADLARGFSWTLKIKVYANNMDTVGTLIIESWRMTDLPQQ